MTTILLFVGGYFVLLGTLSIAVRPYRTRLANLASEILCDSESEDVRRYVQDSLRTAYSMRSAPAHVLGYIIGLLTPSERLSRDAAEWAKRFPDFMQDRRWMGLSDYHLASVAAVNPLFGALLYVLRMLFRLKLYLFVRRHYRPSQPKVVEIEMFNEMKVAA
jgi:hypothetical protein